MEASDYRKVNESYRRRLIYHAGIDCGFFVELNYMVNAMLHCLANGYRFELYTDDANFGTGIGWTEYFVPFCDEVHESFHHKYNQHRPPTWRRILRNTARTRSPSFIIWKLKFLMKSLIGKWLAFRAYGEMVWLSQDVASEPDKFYHILMKVRAGDPYVTAIDCPQDMLPSCLALNIDDRAIISQRVVASWGRTE